MLQTFDVATRRSIWQSLACTFKTLFIAKTFQPRTHNSVYSYSNDIHNLATIDLLSQQLFAVLFFLVKFKTLGLMDEPDLAAKLCAKALSSK